jgi:hypothetical protein
LQLSRGRGHIVIINFIDLLAEQVTQSGPDTAELIWNHIEKVLDILIKSIVLLILVLVIDHVELDVLDNIH